MISKKKSPAPTGDQNQNADTHEGELMYTTVAPTIDELFTRFAKIRADVDEVIERRTNLFVTTQAELIAAGIDAAIVPNRKFDTGQMVTVWDEYSRYGNGLPAMHRVTAARQWMEHLRENDDRWGAYDYGSDVYVCRGLYEVLVIDGKTVLVAEVQERDQEHGHKRAVGRLRRLARAEHMRVQVRDRAVTLISPMNDIVHEGDVNTAYLWLSGVDLTRVRHDDYALEFEK